MKYYLSSQSEIFDNKDQRCRKKQHKSTCRTQHAARNRHTVFRKRERSIYVNLLERKIRPKQVIRWTPFSSRLHFAFVSVQRAAIGRQARRQTPIFSNVQRGGPPTRCAGPSDTEPGRGPGRPGLGSDARSQSASISIPL